MSRISDRRWEHANPDGADNWGSSCPRCGTCFERRTENEAIAAANACAASGCDG